MRTVAHPAHMPLLRFDRDADPHFAFALMKVHVERVRQIEAALASVAAPAGSASLKVAVVSRVPGHRSVFSGRETLGRQTLAEALERVCVRPWTARISTGTVKDRMTRCTSPSTAWRCSSPARPIRAPATLSIWPPAAWFWRRSACPTPGTSGCSRTSSAHGCAARPEVPGTRLPGTRRRSSGCAQAIHGPPSSWMDCRSRSAPSRRW